METFRSTLSEFLRDLRAQKLRTFLTVFGIIWGTVAIIVLLSFGMGFKRQLAINMHGIGERVAILFPGRTSKAFEGYGVGRPISFISALYEPRYVARQRAELPDDSAAAPVV